MIFLFYAKFSSFFSVFGSLQKFWDSDNLANRKGGFMKKIILWITIFALLLTTKTVSAATQDTFYEGSYIPNA